MIATAPHSRLPPHRFWSWWRRVFDWIGRHETSVLICLLLFFLACWAFAELANRVMAGETQEFDEWCLRAFRRSDNPTLLIGPQWLQEVARDITALGGYAVLTLVFLSVVAYLWLRGLFAAMWLVSAATVGGYLMSSLFKILFERDRPAVVPHLSIASGYSFPSGHSMVSAVVYLTLGALLGRFVPEIRLKAFYLCLAIFLTFLVGISRVFLGVHYPTDVLAGWTAGGAWSLLCWLAARWLQKRGTVERDSASPLG
jgi:undecaprenyl-diphosphatase